LALSVLANLLLVTISGSQAGRRGLVL